MRNTHVQVRYQFEGVGSFLPPCGSWASNSGPLPTEPYLFAGTHFFFKLSSFAYLLMCTHICAKECMWKKEDSLRESVLLPPCGTQGWNSSCHAWQLATYPLSHLPVSILFFWNGLAEFGAQQFGKTIWSASFGDGPLSACPALGLEGYIFISSLSCESSSSAQQTLH